MDRMRGEAPKRDAPHKEKEELSDEVKTEYLGLILATVTGVSAGLQNTG